MTEQAVVDAQVVEDAESPDVQGRALERITPGSTALIAGATAAEQVKAASEIAAQLTGIIRERKLSTRIGKSTHINVEGWQTLAAFLRLAVIPGDPVPLRDDDGQLLGFRCRTEVYRDGVLVSAGSSRCMRSEQRWDDADDYAIEGMAQTRSISRAIASNARWIVTLAGYSGTPAEELHGAQGSPPYGPEAPEGTQEKFARALEELGVRGEPLGDLQRQILDDCGGYLPLSVHRAVLRAAVAVRECRQAATSDVPADPPTDAAQGASDDIPDDPPEANTSDPSETA